MEDLILQLNSLVESRLWMAPLIALVSGFLVSFMPCSLSTIPLIIGCIGGADVLDEGNRKRAFILSLLFALGSTVTFMLLGLLVSVIGNLLEGAQLWMHLIMGIVLILMALQMWGVIELLPHNSLTIGKKFKGGIGALVCGVIAGVFSSHCALPMVAALMAIAADRAAAVFGIGLLLLFSIGHSVLSIVAGTSVGFVQRLLSSKKYERICRIVRVVLGVVIALVALYLLWEVFAQLFLDHAHSH